MLLKTQTPIDTGSDSDKIVDISKIEKEVIENTQAKLDINRVTNAFFERKEDDTKNNNKIAFTAASISSLALFLVWHNYIISIVSFALIYFIALGDPLEEDSIIGALARILGRSTLSILSSSEPRVKSILRASIKGDDELLELRSQVQILQEENKSLRMLLLKKEAIENELPKYSLDQLKQLCREKDISGYSGLTKEKLFTKLVDDGIIKLNL